MTLNQLDHILQLFKSKIKLLDQKELFTCKHKYFYIILLYNSLQTFTYNII